MRQYEQYECISDEELIVRLRAGQPEISDYLMEKYKGIVRKKARELFLIGGDRDDLIQEGMIGLFKAVQDYQPDKKASFLTFANLCIERQIYSAIQNSNRMKHQPLNTYVSLSQEDDGGWEDTRDENPEAIMIDRENVDTLKKKIRDSLSSMENQVLEYYLDGCSYGEIAELMGKSQKSVYNTLQRIRNKIKKYKKPIDNYVEL